MAKSLEVVSDYIIYMIMTTFPGKTIFNTTLFSMYSMYVHVCMYVCMYGDLHFLLFKGDLYVKL